MPAEYEWLHVGLQLTPEGELVTLPLFAGDRETSSMYGVNQRPNVIDPVDGKVIVLSNFEGTSGCGGTDCGVGFSSFEKP